MSSSDEFEDLVTTNRREEKSRARSGRASRYPVYGEVREDTRGGKKRKECPEAFWEEVCSGRLGIKPLDRKTPAEILRDRDTAALIDGQVVQLSEESLVSVIGIVPLA